MAIKCLHPSCKEVVRDGKNRCDKHRKTTNSSHSTIKHKVLTPKRDRRNGKFYDSARWRRVSIKQRTKFPMCSSCEDKGITMEAHHADHIVEIEDGGSPYSLSNLKSLCRSCHTTKTNLVRAERNAPKRDIGLADL